MARAFLLLFISILIITCKSDTPPIVYDKKTDTVAKESELIYILIKNSNFKEAETHLEKDLKLFPSNPDLLQLRGWLLLSQNDLDGSEKIFLYLLDANNKNPLAYAGLARISRIKGDGSKAAEYLKKGLSLSSLPVLWFEKGILEYEAKDYRKALVDFNKSYNMDNKNTDAFFFKYLTLLKLGRPIDEIKQYWETILKNASAKNWYFTYHSEALHELGISGLALDVIRNGIMSYPDDVYIINMLSFLLYEKYLKDKDDIVLKEAKDIMQKLLGNTDKLEPEFIDTYFLILEASSDNDLLKKEINKYFLFFPNSELILKWVKKYNQ